MAQVKEQKVEDAQVAAVCKKYNINLALSAVDSDAVFKSDWVDLVDSKWECDAKQVARLPKGFDDAFTIPLLKEEECVQLIKRTEAMQYGDCGYARSHRNNARLICEDPALAQKLYERMKPQLLELVPEVRHNLKTKMYGEFVGKYKMVGFNPRFRYCRYIKDQKFEPHCDAFIMYDNKVSVYTVNIYLNEYKKEYTGGRTLFYDGSFQLVHGVEPTAGMALIFNHTTESYMHAGERLSSGVKYLMRTDIMYQHVDDETP